MRLLSIASVVGALIAATTVTASSLDSTALQRCSVNDFPTTCPKDQYCLAARPHSYCTKKLDGGKQCTNDNSCKSNICFIAKERHDKRVCASLPLKDYPLGAQCTQSTQCKEKFCDKGYCKKPVGAGEKCPKEVGCADLDKGAHCLKKAATFVVYTSAGKKQTKKLSAGRCSYISDLGEGMKCSSNANCYGEKFTCSKKTKTCTAKASPSKLPYNEACSASSQCASGACVSGKCGCQAEGSDCSDTEVCASDSTCQAKLLYDSLCEDNDQCLSNSCIDPRASRRSPSPFYKSCGCTASDQCPGSKVCDRGTNTCNTPTPTNLPYQTPCETNEECASNRCTPNGKCGCDKDSNSDCSSAEFCDISSRVCNAKLPYDADCGTSVQCRSGACAGTTHTCKCTGKQDCLNDQFCDYDGTCQPKLEVEESCNRNEECVTGTCVSNRSWTATICGCDADDQCGTGTGYCDSKSNLCGTKGSYGDRCSSTVQCTSDTCNDDGTCGCSDSSPCSGSDVCDRGTNTCTTIALPYQTPCQQDSRCASGACVNESCGCDANGSDCAASDFCGEDATCQAKLSYASPCTSDTQCSESVCVLSVTGRGLGKRDAQGVCGCSSDSACNPNSEFCNLQTNLCTAKHFYTASCDSGNQCQSGTCLDDNSCGCAPPTPFGSDCDDSAYCASDGTCKAKAAFRAQCSSSDECSSGACVSGQCACTIGGSDCSSSQFCAPSTQSCTSKLAATTACQDDSWCQSGKCNTASQTCAYSGYCFPLYITCKTGTCTSGDFSGPSGRPLSCTCNPANGDADCGWDSFCVGSGPGPQTWCTKNRPT